VAILGIILSTLIGVIMGIARLSTNWLVARVASAYIESLRNVPLLLQLFFWYAIITQLLPPVRDAVVLLPGVVLSKSGLQFPALVYDPALLPVLAAIGLSVLVALIHLRWVRRRQERTGERPP